MNIAGTKLSEFLSRYHSGVNRNNTVKTTNQTLQNLAAHYQYNAGTQAGFQVLYRSEPVDDVRAASMIDAADEGLSRTETVLRKIKELLNNCNDLTKSLNDADYKKINDEFQKLLEELNQISNNNPMLDGSFGGIQGKDGVQATGIDEIVSTGNFNGKVKLNIEFRQNRVEITARNGNNSVTNVLKFSDTETVFDFNGSKITLKFSNGAGNLQSGIVKDISFSPGNKNADLTKAVSRARYPADGIYTTNKNNKTVKIPNLTDVSSVGLGLNGRTIKSILDSKATMKKVNESLGNIVNMRGRLFNTRVAVSGFTARG